MQEVVRIKVIKFLDAGIIYPIFDSKWVSPIHVVPKRARLTVVKNKDNEFVPTRIQSGWRVCIDYRKLNIATRKDHFLLLFIDQMVERLAGTNIIASWMVILDITRSLWTSLIRRRQHLLVLLEHLPTIACLLGCTIHLLLFNDV
jgi:hypothetical protein